MPKAPLIAAAIVFAITTPACAGFINLNAPFPPGPTFIPLSGNVNMVEASAPGGWGGTIAGYVPTSTMTSGLQNAGATFGPLDLIGQLTSTYNYTTSGAESLTFNGNIFDPSGNGNLIASNHLTGTITWNSFHFVDEGSYSVGPTLFGTGIITDSSGNDEFETDFPIDGAFRITAQFLTPCGRLPSLCAPNQIEGTSLIGGNITPVAVPSPPIGKLTLPLLFGAALLVFVKRSWRSPHRG